MERIPFPNKLVNLWDIAKGLGDIALDFLIHPKEPMVSHGDHFNRGAAEQLDMELYDQHVDFQGITRLVPRDCADERFDNVIQFPSPRGDDAA